MMTVPCSKLQKYFTSDGLAGQIWRFLTSGSLNVVISLTVYELMVIKFSPTVSYLTAWTIGVLIVSVLYPLFVFKNKTLRFSKSLFTTLYYVAYAAVSVFLLNWVISLGVHKAFAPVVVLCIVTPVTFIFSRFIYKEPVK